MVFMRHSAVASVTLLVAVLGGIPADGMGDAGEPACLEEGLVEAEEDAFADDMSTSLLQKTLKHSREPMVSAATALSGMQVASTVSDQPVATSSSDSTAASNATALGQVHQAPAVNCTEKPQFCNPMINCGAEPLTAASKVVLEKRLASEDGHINYRGWCMVYPQYATSLQRCVIERNPAAYARDTIKEQEGLNLLYADAVYCYASGHCKRAAPNLTTTPSEMEGLCDAAYGHERWANIGYSELRGVFNMAYDMTKKYFENKTSWEDIRHVATKQADAAAMAACAMGNFHCDAIYCHTHFCGNDKYEKFTEFAP